MRRASYRDAVEFVALNDDPSELDVENIIATVTVGLVAHIFGKERTVVADDVSRVRAEAQS